MPTTTNFITELQELISRPGVSHKVSSIVKDVDVAAMLSKVVKPRETNRPQLLNGDTENYGANSGIEQISRAIAARIEDNENIFKLFPDIELCVQTIVAAVMSPKDMVNDGLIFRAENSALPTAVVTELLAIIKEEIEKNYKLKEELPEIIRDMLFTSGSHIKAVIPESAVDQLINSGKTIATESIYSEDVFSPQIIEGRRKIEHLGILGNSKEEASKGNVFAIEAAMSHGHSSSYDPQICIDPYKEIKKDALDIVNVLAVAELARKSIEIVDNYNCLKLPSLLEAINAQQISRVTGSSMKNRSLQFATESVAMFETKNRPTPKELSNMIYKTPSVDFKPLQVMPSPMTMKRKSVGRPLVLDISSQACIPVHTPGKPEAHVGYIFCTDVDGNFINPASPAQNNAGGLSSYIQSDKTGAAASSLLTEKARQNLVGNTEMPHLEHMADIYAEIIEGDMLTRLSKGIYGKTLSIARNNELTRIMYARALQAKFTRLVYVPAEYVSYFAVQYHSNGVGKSYLDDLSNITSLRAMIVFSKVLASVKNSIETTHAHVTLDPRDADPVKSMEMIKHFVARSRQQYFPHGLNRVADLTDWIQRAGIQITYEGHPRLPSTKIDFESKNIQHTMPDDGLEELFRKQTQMHCGVTPEMMDTAAGSDFATSIEKTSVLFSRRVKIISDKTSAVSSDYARKISSYDQVIQERLVKVLEDHRADIESRMDEQEKAMLANDPGGFTAYVLQDFIECLVVDLPKPEETSTNDMMTSIVSYEKVLDMALKYIFASNVLPNELGGDSAQYVEALKEVWKATLMRKWMAENNFAPKAFDITSMTDDGKPMIDLLDMTAQHSKAIMLSITSLLDKMKEAKEAAAKDMSALNPGDPSDVTDTSSGGESGSGSEGGEGGDGSGGGDDFSFSGLDELGPPDDGSGSGDDEAAGAGGGDDSASSEGKSPDDEGPDAPAA